MIIDCFPFFNELEVLDLRLNILNPYVDKFILVESSKTQSYIDKPYYFEENKHLYSKFLDKIVHVKMDKFPQETAWALENFQRNYIFKGLTELKLTVNDIIAISDVDEIWNPFFLNEIKENLQSKNFISITMDYLVFKLNLETVNKKWTGSVFTKIGHLNQVTPQGLRNIKDRIHTLNNAGWHFGYQGGREKVYEKYFSCVEPLNKTLIPAKEDFFKIYDERIKDGGSFIYSDNIQDQSVKLQKYKLENLPKYIQLNIEKYKNMLSNEI